MNETICPGCGNPVEQGTAFCPYCGTRVTHNDAEPEASQNSSRNQRQSVPPTWSSERQDPYRMPPYASYPSYAPQRQPGHGWITFLRVFIWIMFAAIVLLGCYYTVLLIQVRRSFGWVLLMFLSCGLIATLILAAGMVGLNCAEHLYDIAQNTRRTNELLEELRRK